MKIYLDIDGVLLTKTGEVPAGIVEFLKKVTEHDCYWLTTHCKSEEYNNADRHLKKRLPEECFEYIDKVKPNSWDYLKTEGIDFSSDFIWFDDNLMPAEKRKLEENNAVNNFRLINLRENPDQLLKEIF